MGAGTAAETDKTPRRRQSESQTRFRVPAESGKFRSNGCMTSEADNTSMCLVPPRQGTVMW
eukprot:scaffold30476_cov54-Phaeocystis_antarctica.AAC.1